MAQVSLLGWVTVKQKRKVVIYRFLKDLPAFMVSEKEVSGPFHKGDLVSADELPEAVWRVLLRRGVVEAYSIEV